MGRSGHTKESRAKKVEGFVKGTKLRKKRVEWHTSQETSLTGPSAKKKGDA